MPSHSSVYFRIATPLRGLNPADRLPIFVSNYFRITSPLRGLTLVHTTFAEYNSIFRITSPLRGYQNAVSLYPWPQYRCVNSTPCYLRPPMRGLKLIDGRITVCTASLELSPHCGDIQKEPLGILLGGSFFVMG